MYFKQKLGKYGETVACTYLEKNNYKILDKNFVCKQGEIDIIAFSDLKELIFIEVKTRSNLNFGVPSEAVNKYKKNHILASSKYYIFIILILDMT